MAAGGARKLGAQKEGEEPWRGWGKAAPNTSQDIRMWKGKRVVLIGQCVTSGKNHTNLYFCGLTAQSPCWGQVGIWLAYQCQVGWGSEQPDLVKDVPASCSGVGLDDL